MSAKPLPTMLSSHPSAKASDNMRLTLHTLTRSGARVKKWWVNRSDARPWILMKRSCAARECLFGAALVSAATRGLSACLFHNVRGRLRIEGARPLWRAANSDLYKPCGISLLNHARAGAMVRATLRCDGRPLIARAELRSRLKRRRSNRGVVSPHVHAIARPRRC